MGAAEALREPMGGGMLPEEHEEYDATMETLRATLDADTFASAWAAGRALDMNAAVAYAVE